MFVGLSSLLPYMQARALDFVVFCCVFVPLLVLICFASSLLHVGPTFNFDFCVVQWLILLVLRVPKNAALIVLLVVVVVVVVDCLCVGFCLCVAVLCVLLQMNV